MPEMPTCQTAGSSCVTPIADKVAVAKHKRNNYGLRNALAAWFVTGSPVKPATPHRVLPGSRHAQVHEGVQRYVHLLLYRFTS